MKWIVILLVVIVAGAVGSYWYEGYSARSKLLEQPVYRVLEKHEPAVFDKLVDEYKLYAREETRRENFINLANSEISLVATRSIAHASQDSVLALMQDMIATARRLQLQPGDACFRYWFPQVSGPPDIAKYIDRGRAGAYARPHGRSHTHGQRKPFAAASRGSREGQSRAASSTRPTSSTARMRR